ncbi:MAG: uracil-DNA glycosylase, partial [Bartonella sp.]|nr:uracil-DNA glycosylase [Bartonella sp.]
MSEKNKDVISNEDLLSFYKESGVNAALTDVPIDHFNQTALL